MPATLKVVMFTDQVKSTPNTARRALAEVKQVAHEQDELTAAVVRQYGGSILKDTGDGALIEFQSCAVAVQCGYVLQQRVKARNEAQTNERLKFELHIGIDLGELVVLPNGDVRGNAVNRAARVCSECLQGEVYFTEKVMGELHPHGAQVAKVGPVELKGVEGEVILYRIVDWIGEIDSAPNPFIWRGAIARSEDLFDRESELSTLRAYVHGRQNCQIVGERRIGKSSLLRNIENVATGWDNSFVVAYLDLQDARCFSLTGLLSLSSRQLGWPKSATNLSEFADFVDTSVSEGRRPVLCLDEFEELTLRRSEFSRDFFLTLRSCGQQGLSIITASRKPLSGLTDQSDPTSPFYNTFPVLRLGSFSESDAQDFVSIHRPGVTPFTPQEKNAILEFARHHPLALQVACFHVLQAKENRENLITAMERAKEDMKAHLRSW